MLNYLVVGLGLAGLAFCEQLEKQGKRYHVISDHSQTASSVAGGIYNPVVLKRLTLAWKAQEQIELAKLFYKKLELKLDVTVRHSIPILRRFASIEEQNLWFEAIDKPHLKPFLSPIIHPNRNASIDTHFGYGKVLHTGRIDTRLLLVRYFKHLKDAGKVSGEHFDHDALEYTETGIAYKSLRAEKIIFSEGFGLHKNPYFNYLPLKGAKGEYLIIYAPLLKEEYIIKSSLFCIPLGNDSYKIGANYEHEDKSNLPTEKAKEELLRKIKQFIKCDFELIGHIAGVRPTVADRKPLVGQHPINKMMYVLNGLGSRGVLIAPFVAQHLLQFIEADKKLPEEIDCRRFKKLHPKI